MLVPVDPSARETDLRMSSVDKTAESTEGLIHSCGNHPIMEGYRTKLELFAIRQTTQLLTDAVLGRSLQKKRCKATSATGGVSTTRRSSQSGARSGRQQIAALSCCVWTQVDPCEVHVKRWPRRWRLSACVQQRLRQVPTFLHPLLILF